MKFNRTTVILVILALGLSTFIYIAEKNNDFITQIDSDNTSKSEKIFPFDTEEIKTISIDNNQQKITFAKTENQIKPWEMTSPEKTKASDAAISFLTNLFHQATNQQEIPDTEKNLEEYGLQQPNGTIKLTLNNGDEYTVNLGNSNFDNTKIYAQIIFPQSQSGKPKIFLISKSFQYAIKRDFDEWKEIYNNTFN